MRYDTRVWLLRCHKHSQKVFFSRLIVDENSGRFFQRTIASGEGSEKLLALSVSESIAHTSNSRPSPATHLVNAIQLRLLSPLLLIEEFLRSSRIAISLGHYILPRPDYTSNFACKTEAKCAKLLIRAKQTLVTASERFTNSQLEAENWHIQRELHCAASISWRKLMMGRKQKLFYDLH
jgi:hypothetical protein